MTLTTVEAARRRLRDIVRRADKLGLARDDLVSLPSARHLRSCQGSRLWQWRGAALLGAVVVALVGAALTRCYIAQDAGEDPWRQQQYQALCTVDMPQHLVRAFRPPEDCELCRGLRQVDRVANISPENFQERYTHTGRPVVVTDATRNWTAQHVFNFRFLKSVFHQQSHDCQLQHAKSGFANLEQVFNSSWKTNFEPWHTGWRNCDERASAILRQHYSRPYFLPPGDENTKLEWIYLGSPGYRETMRIDVVEQPSWQAQLRGSKKWFLHPPPECYYQCESLDITVQPGDIIVLDTTRWYHETTVISQELSIAVGAQFDIT